MIDTISIFAPNDESSPFDFNCLEKSYSTIPHTTGEMLTGGELKNLFVSQRSTGLFISGSIPKYLFNENLTIPSLEQIENALNEIANKLNFDLKSTNVYRIDLGYNFRLEHNVKNYLNQFGELRKFTKMNVNDLETLRYSIKGGSKQLIFYHKILEMKKKGVPIPKDYKELDHYILRYEIRLRNLKNELGLDEINATMLYDEDFLSLIIQRWYDYYHRIHKIPKVRFRSYVFSGQKRLKDSLAAIGIQTLGYDDVMNRIDMVKKKYGKTQISRLRRMVRKLSSNKDATVSYPLTKELDKKVDYVFNNYIKQQS